MGELTVQEVPGRVLEHPARAGKTGSVSVDPLNPALSMGHRRPVCQCVISPIPMISKSITPPPTTRNAGGSAAVLQATRPIAPRAGQGADRLPRHPQEPNRHRLHQARVL
jgi:hypothetical protein